jgi:hypothetical protein
MNEGAHTRQVLEGAKMSAVAMKRCRWWGTGECQTKALRRLQKMVQQRLGDGCRPIR